LFDSKFVFLEGSVICTYYMMVTGIFQNQLTKMNCALSIVLILLSVVLDSQFLLVLGGLGVFFYLSFLAYRVFRNSLLFPFALTVLGISIIALGVFYQKNQEGIRTIIFSLLPDVMLKLRNYAANVQDQGSTNQIMKSLEFLFWPANLFNYVKTLPIYVLPLALLCIIVLIIIMKIFNPKVNRVPICQLSKCEVVWPTDTDGHGMIFNVAGRKPRELCIKQARLVLVSDSLWRALEWKFGASAISAFKIVFYPAKLIPTMMPKNALSSTKSEKFDTQISIGTGILANGKTSNQRVGHPTLQTTLQGLRNNCSERFDIDIQYSERLGTKKGVLFTITVSLDELLRAGTQKGTPLNLLK